MLAFAISARRFATEIRIGARAASVVLAVATNLVPVAAMAQSEMFGPGPERVRPAPEDEAQSERILPVVPYSETPGTDAMRAGRRFRVERYRFTGATLVEPGVLEALARPYSGREVSYAEVDELRAAITKAYFERGYVSSGAIIPDQVLTDGIFEIRVVEGTLETLTVTTDGRLRTGALRAGILRQIDGTPNVFQIEEVLQLVQRNELIARVHARLEPGSERGAARLVIDLEEAPSIGLRAAVANDTNPVVGETTGRFGAHHLDVLGFGDALRLDVGISSGLNQFVADYALPVGSYGTSIGFRLRISDSQLVSGITGIEDLDFAANSESYALFVDQSLIRTLSHEISAYVMGEIRRSETTIAGNPAPINSVANPHLSVIRLGTEWDWRRSAGVFSARSIVSFGIDAFDATTNPNLGPDATFTAWLGQAQYAQRIPWRDAQMLLRADVQLADSPLLGLERIGIGGLGSVRGYRQSLIVRDNASVVSASLDVPVYRSGQDLAISLSPFVDYGVGWNEGSDRQRTSLASVGVAARMRFLRNAVFDFAWGQPLLDRKPKDLERSVQDIGLHIGVRVTYP